MDDQFKMLGLTTSGDTTIATGSEASESGLTPCPAPTSISLGSPGPEAAPASRSRSRAGAAASTIPATCGRTGFGSLKSAGLTASLVSNLQTQVRGSILYEMTWKVSALPSGVLIYRLRASAARTSDPGITGWPTPTTPSGGQTVPPGTSVTGRKPDGSKVQVTLEMVARFAGWATPTAGCGGGEYADPEKAFRRLMDTRRSYEIEDQVQAIRLSGWATPANRDYRTPNLASYADRGGGPRGEQLNNQVVHQGPALTGSSAEVASTARLNPELPRWLLRLPPAWCDSAVTAMPWTPKSRRNSSKRT